MAPSSAGIAARHATAPHTTYIAPGLVPATSVRDQFTTPATLLSKPHHDRGLDGASVVADALAQQEGVHNSPEHELLCQKFVQAVFTKRFRRADDETDDGILVSLFFSLHTRTCTRGA